MNKLLYRIYKLAQDRKVNIFDMFSEEFSRVLKTMPESSKFVNPSISLLEFFENDDQINKLIRLLNSKLTIINFHELKSLAQDLNEEEYSHADLDMSVENLEKNLKTLFDEFKNKLKEYDVQNMSGMMKDFSLLSVCYNLIYLSNIKLKVKQKLPVNLNDKFVDEKTKDNIIENLFKDHLDDFKILNPMILGLTEPKFYLPCFFLLDIVYGKKIIKIENINSDEFKNALYSLINYYFLDDKYINVLEKVFESNIFQDGGFGILMDTFLSSNLKIFYKNTMEYSFVFKAINNDIDMIKKHNIKTYNSEFVRGILDSNEDLKMILKSNLNLQKEFKQYVVNLAMNELDVFNTSSKEKLQLKEKLYKKLKKLQDDDNSIFDEKVIPVGVIDNKPTSFIDLISTQY